MKIKVEDEELKIALDWLWNSFELYKDLGGDIPDFVDYLQVVCKTNPMKHDWEIDMGEELYKCLGS